MSNDCISRQAAQAKIKSICDEYRLSYEDGERKAATGGSAYALGHAFDDIPSVTPKPKIVPIAEVKFDDDMLHEIVEEAVKNIEIEPKWISVSERLPEEYGEYLITWTTSQDKRPFIGISEGEVTSEYDHEHNRFKFEWLLEDYVKNYPDVKVIAWMPLPKPYEPQERSDKE